MATQSMLTRRWECDFMRKPMMPPFLRSSMSALCLFQKSGRRPVGKIMPSMAELAGRQ